ncbi:hypothetical protein [Inhella gelatinilytica]|uniref:NnrS family protein n=1 Tax=Inhella gelatinilytica TaxID=2795030 RepID=A0A931IW44_9BURK|nr:hypothetical protein [Inhella gelatinilytica]MBH9552090.1 hypothetical protein [Inhella gelatinilytica]
MSGRPAVGAARARMAPGLAWRRLPVLALGLLSLLLGVLSGWARLGLPAPVPVAQGAGQHALWMILAFFGTVIALERAVALGSRWAYVAPLLAGLGGVLLLRGGPALLCFALSSTILLAATLQLWRRQPEPHAGVLVLAAAGHAVGCGLFWAGAALNAVLPLWLGFLVLTIAGERLELSRLRPRAPGALLSFALWVGLHAGAALGAAWGLPGSDRFLGGAWLGLALWLMRHDVARHTVRQRGLTGYIAVCLLSGYGWLLLAGAWGVTHGLPLGTPGTDAALHALLLGFVFAMVMGHAPIIGPALLRIQLPFHPAQYLPVIVLHVSVAGRVAADLLSIPWGRSVAAWGHALALVLFIGLLVWRARAASSSSSLPRHV